MIETETRILCLTINGSDYAVAAPNRRKLVDLLCYDLGLVEMTVSAVGGRYGGSHLAQGAGLVQRLDGLLRVTGKASSAWPLRGLAAE
jgi:hypothetical protein